jgi:phosphoglycolate phosphatase
VLALLLVDLYPTPMPVLTVVFDLDGTLVDTAPDLIDTLNTIFAREGLTPVALEDARNMVGGGARRLIERGLQAQERPVATTEADRLFADFIAHYSNHIADRSRPFPGLEDALDQLAANGNQFAVCTNKLEWLSTKLLDALGLTNRFVAICGQDTFGVPKPHPSILLRTIERAGGRPEHAVMVGDSATDVNTARAAGIPIVAVDFGYTDVPAPQLGADRVISSFDQLRSAIFEVLPGNFVSKGL